MATPFKRDILLELARACERGGIQLCFYHSIMDWTHDDYVPHRSWDPRKNEDADFDRYVGYMKEQLKELVSVKYGKIGILWFDGEWEESWTHERGLDLAKYVHSLDPDIIINNRVDKGRSGMAGMNGEGDWAGDYGTPEQEVPSTGFPGRDWETCMTMNDTWGFKSDDHNWKSAKEMIRMLCAIDIGPESNVVTLFFINQMTAQLCFLRRQMKCPSCVGKNCECDNFRFSSNINCDHTTHIIWCNNWN